LLLRLASLALFIAAWYVGSLVAGGRMLPGPDTVLAAVLAEARSGELFLHLGATLARVAPGEVEIAMPVSDELCQQHGFVHAGIVSTLGDTACGYAAFSLMPASAGVLTTEFKVNLLAPATGERLVAVGRVVKPGRTLTVWQAEVFGETGSERRLVALLTATLMAIEGREDVRD
jgi:uncharacterized protein (TIGR00369 family)